MAVHGGYAHKFLIENKIVTTLEKHVMQTDANCMVQLAKGFMDSIHTAKKYEDLPRELSCYGIGINASLLMLFIRRTEINFTLKQARTYEIYSAPCSPLRSTR